MQPALRRAGSSRRPHAVLGVALLAVGWVAFWGAAARAQDEQEPAAPAAEAAPAAAAARKEAAPKKPIFQVQRIELSLFGGPFGGATFLELPDIQDPDRTRDLGATDILDFSGQPLKRNGEDIRAPHKELDSGVLIGGAATFYLGDRFGLSLRGAYGTTQATVTGYTDSDRTATPPGQTPQPYEWDRSDVSIYQFGAGMLYHVGKARLRPWVTLGFGGILNSFPRTDDVGALYFLYGGGLRYPVSNRLIAHVGVESTLYSYKNDEIVFNETITLPMLTVGLSWRHDVPPPPVATDDAPAAEPASGS